jgi:replicative DNA helicase
MKSDETNELPPNSLEAEQSLIGGLLVSADDGKFSASMDSVMEYIRDERDFYDLRWQIVWTILVDLDSRGLVGDLITVSGELKRIGRLEEIGGIAALSQLQDDSVPFLLTQHAEIVAEHAARRRMLRAAGTITGIIHGGAGTVVEQIAQAQQAVLDVTYADEQGKIIDTKSGLKIGVDIIQRLYEHRGRGLQSGLLTGLGFLDKRLGGIAPGQVFYIGAPQSTGKTSLLLTIMRHMAVNCEVPVGFMSVESRYDEVLMRMLANMAKVNWQQCRTGFMANSDLPKFTAAVGELAKAKWFVCDQGSVTPSELRRQCRRLVVNHGCKVIFIDHFHRLHDPTHKDPRMEANAIVRSIRWVARSLGVPVIVAAQVSREAKKEGAARSGRKPQATDIRESAAIEEDADIMGILAKDFPDTVENDNGQSGFDPDGDEWPMNLEIVKQRNGPTGPVELTFKRTCFRYEDRYGNTGGVQAGERKLQREHQQEIDVT